MLNAIPWRAADFPTFAAQVLVYLLAGMQLSAALTAMTEIYRIGKRRMGESPEV
jgi:hypothetical protein